MEIQLPFVSLFDSFDRIENDPREYSESYFDFLNRTARPGFDHVRSEISKWIANYPSHGRFDLVRRLKANEEHKFHAAFLELYMHELLRITGHKLVVETALENNTRPDFLATRGVTEAEYVECTAVTAESDDDQSRRAHIERICDMIRDIESPDFYINVCPLTHSKSKPSLAKWQLKIEAWLKSLDYDSGVRAAANNQYQSAKLLLVHPEVNPTTQIELTVIPKLSAHGKSGGSLGIHSTSSLDCPNNSVSTARAIQSKVDKKSSHYGKVDKPLLLVLSCIAPNVLPTEIREAFWGRKGLWENPQHKKHPRVSAVITLHHLLPWSITCSDSVIFHNPGASIPYTGPLSLVTQSTPQGDIPGTHPRDHLKLPEKWPFDL